MRGKAILNFAVVVAAFLIFALQGPASAETLLERGTYLMKGPVACGNCHTPKGPKGELPGMELAGGFKIEEEPFTAITSNITPDKETGIGNWTDEQIIRAIREGVRPDGAIIGPPMPIGFYRGMSDRDVKAIVAYLRQVKPVKNKVAKSVYRIPLPKSYGPAVGSVPDVPKDDKLKYGEYLVRIAHCFECHTPMVKGRRDFKNQLGAGGFPFHGPWGTIFAANVTPDKKAGIGDWTDRQVKIAITNGVRKTGEKMLPPMPYPYFKNLTREDLDAIVAYVRTIKPNPKLRKVRHVPPKK
ncbi:MAG: c-type cytochrome [Nitrospinota bacterium]